MLAKCNVETEAKMHFFPFLDYKGSLERLPHVETNSRERGISFLLSFIHPVVDQNTDLFICCLSPSISCASMTMLRSPQTK